jgi:hypothetical protein
LFSIAVAIVWQLRHAEQEVKRAERELRREEKKVERQEKLEWKAGGRQNMRLPMITWKGTAMGACQHPNSAHETWDSL